MTLHFDHAHPRKNRRVQIGLTLLELLVVLAIISLTLIFVSPNLTGSSSRAVLEQTARKIAATLTETRAAAIRRNEALTFSIDLDAHSFGSSARQTKSAYSSDINVRMITARSELYSDTVAAIRFWPDGSSTGAEIDLRSGGHGYRVNVDWLTGTVDVEKLDNVQTRN